MPGGAAGAQRQDPPAAAIALRLAATPGTLRGRVCQGSGLPRAPASAFVVMPRRRRQGAQRAVACLAAPGMRFDPAEPCWGKPAVLEVPELVGGRAAARRLRLEGHGDVASAVGTMPCGGGEGVARPQ